MNISSTGSKPLVVIEGDLYLTILEYYRSSYNCPSTKSKERRQFYKEIISAGRYSEKNVQPLFNFRHSISNSRNESCRQVCKKFLFSVGGEDFITGDKERIDGNTEIFTDLFSRRSERFVTMWRSFWNFDF